MTTKTYLEYTDIFNKLKALFEFDEKGHLYPLAPGMAGPIDMPIGYLDMSKITNQNFKGHLVLTWSTQPVAIIIDNNNQREATTNELEIVYSYYAQAMQNYRNEMIEKYTKEGEEMSPYLQSRIGIIPFHYKQFLENFFSLK